MSRPHRFDFESARSEVEEAVITVLKTTVTYSQTCDELMPAELNLAATLTERRASASPST